MFRPSILQNLWFREVAAPPGAAPANLRDDERTLSIFAIGAYYLDVPGCARLVQLFSVSIRHGVA